MIKKIALYWHTLRYLKLGQVYQRLKFIFFHPKPNCSPSPELRAYISFWRGSVQLAPSLIGPWEFSFFGQRGSLLEIGWDGPDRDKLWRYNQHYFADLNAISAIDRYPWHVDILNKWVEQNLPGCGVGWEPYPTSLRIVNWIKWALAGNNFPAICVHSLAIQVRFLSRRLEHHLLGNHLLANAKALVFAGLFFQGNESAAWLRKGLRIIKSEIAEQVLKDGGHFERSPMYHAIILEDLLDLINLSKIFPNAIDFSIVSNWEEIVKKMLFWLQLMTHPDGQFSMFNDTAFNIAGNHKTLHNYARVLEIEVDSYLSESDLTAYWLESSGYIRIASNKAVVFLDVAPVGPDYLPGHAHADSLSFELSVYGQRVIVNGGTSQYGVGFQRSIERKTQSHSTVEVDGLSSSEVWGAFRVARRAKPFNLEVNAEKDNIFVACSHDGYKRLKGNPIHRREWILTTGNLTIRDWIKGGSHTSIARFILHPTTTIVKESCKSWSIYTPLGDSLQFKVLEGEGFIETASYAPEFGNVIKTQCIAIRLVSGKSHVTLQWH